MFFPDYNPRRVGIMTETTEAKTSTIRRPRFWSNLLTWGMVGLFISPIFFQSHPSLHAQRLLGGYGELVLSLFVPALLLTGLRFAIYRWPNRGRWTQLVVIAAYAIFAPLYMVPWDVWMMVMALGIALYLGRLLDCNVRLRLVNPRQPYFPFIVEFYQPRWRLGRRRQELQKHLRAEDATPDGS